MNWLSDYAARAGLTDAQSLLIPIGSTPADAWESTARVLGLTPSELATRIAPQLKLFPANFARTDTHALRLVPETLTRRFNVFPLREDNRQLVIATADPSDLDCEQAIAFAAGRRVAFELAPPSAIAQAIDAAYAGAGLSVDTAYAGAARSEDAAQARVDA